jgi:hypothetical protein
MWCGVTAPLADAEVNDRLVVLISPLRSTDIHTPNEGKAMKSK